MKMLDNAIEIAFALALVIVTSTICIMAYNKSKQPSSLDKLTKCLITKDSLLTKAKLDSINNRSK